MCLLIRAFFWVKIRGLARSIVLGFSTDGSHFSPLSAWDYCPWKISFRSFRLELRSRFFPSIPASYQPCRSIFNYDPTRARAGDSVVTSQLCVPSAFGSRARRRCSRWWENKRKVLLIPLFYSAGDIKKNGCRYGWTVVCGSFSWAARSL